MGKRRNVLENGGKAGNKGNLKTYLQEENTMNNTQNQNQNLNTQGSTKFVNKDAPKEQQNQNKGVTLNTEMTPNPNSVVLTRGEVKPLEQQVINNSGGQKNQNQNQNTSINNTKEKMYDFAKGGQFYDIALTVNKVVPRSSLIFGMQGTEEYTTESVIYAKPVVVSGLKEIVYLGGFTFLLLEKNPQNGLFRILDTTVYLGDNITSYTAEAFLATAAVTRPDDVLDEMIAHVKGYEAQYGNIENFGMGDDDVVVSLLVSRAIIKYLERSSHFKSFKSYNESGLPDICKFKLPNPKLESYRDVRTDLEFTVGVELDKNNFPTYTCWINYNKNSSKYADYKKFSSFEDFTKMLGEILVGSKKEITEVEEAFIRSIPHFLIRNFDAELKALKKNFYIRLEDGSQEKVYPPFAEFPEFEGEPVALEEIKLGAKEGYNAFISTLYEYFN